MRRLLIILLMLSACACNGQAIRFSEPIFDTTQLPDASTSVLLHFDNNFTDLGGNAWSTVGAYPHTFGAAKYGTHSAVATIQAGSSWYSQLKSTNATAATTFGTDDFTIEFWGKALLMAVYGYTYGDIVTVAQVGILSTTSPYKNAAFTFGGYCEAQTIDGVGVPYFASFTPTIYYGDTDGTSANGSIAAQESMNNPQWNHVCFERRTGTLYGYLNGVQVFSASCPYDISAVLETTILSDYNPGALAGYLFVDDLRIKKGGYVYGGAFTPPTRAIGVKKPMEIKLSDGEIKF